MTDADQKRGNQRVDVTLKVQLQYPDRDTFVERFSINVSRTGLFIRARDPAPIGSRVRFEYRLKDDSRIFRGTGVVRWTRAAADAKEPDNPPGMGIEFLDLDSESEDLVTHIVKTRGEGERAPRKQAPAQAKGGKRATQAGKVLSGLGAEEEDDLLAGLSEHVEKPKAPKVEEREPIVESLPLEDLPTELPTDLPTDLPPPPPATDIPEVIFDFAGPSILAAMSMPTPNGPPDRFEERKLALTLGVNGGTLAIGGDGIAVPGLFAWADDRRSARVQVLARKLGLTLVADAKGRPALEVGGNHLALTDIALAAARHTMQAYAEAIAGASVLRVVLPASRSETLVQELNNTLGGSTRLDFVDDLTALAGRSSSRDAVIIAMSAVETRIGRITSGSVGAQLTLIDCGIWDCDQAVQQATARALVKEHGIDVDDDPSLRQALAKQIELGRLSESGDLDVSIAGAPVTIDEAAIEQALYPITARIASTVEALIEPTFTVVWASDEPTWSPLAARVQSLLGHELDKLDPTAWVRLG